MAGAGRTPVSIWRSERSSWEGWLGALGTLSNEHIHGPFLTPLLSLSPPHNRSPNCVDSTPKYLSFYLLLSLLIATIGSCTSPTDLGIGSLRL